MFDFRRYLRLSLRLILSFQIRQQSVSVGTNPVCNGVPWFLHDNVDDSHSCDEYKKWTVLIVYRILESILRLILFIRSRTTRCQVVQFVPSKKIFNTIREKHFWYLQLIQVPFVWIDDRPNKDVKLEKCIFLFATSQYRSTHFWACPCVS